MAKKAEMVFNGQVNVPDIDIEYKGYHIVPKKDFTNAYLAVNTYRKGYNIVKDGMNVAPGASWASSVIEAKVMIDTLIESNGDYELFWKLQREKQGRDLYDEV